MRHRAVLLLALVAAVWPAAGPRALDHECHLFGYVFAESAGSDNLLAALCDGLYEKTLPQARDGGGERESPSSDGWGFSFHATAPHPEAGAPVVLRAGPPACEDGQRWAAAQAEIAAFALPAASCVTGHVRKSSYGPDSGALPDPHPFVDSLGGRWWTFSHNGHMVPDTLLAWIPEAFLALHPLDYEPVRIDSEVLFRYCLHEIEAHGDTRSGLLAALHRVRGYYQDFVFNITLSDGDTLWTAHTHNLVPFYYGAAADSSAWWASTVRQGGSPASMSQHRLYWFTPGSMGSASYD